MNSIYCWHMLVFLLVGAAGCSVESRDEQYAKMVTDEYGQLTRARSSPNAELQDELDRVEDEGGTPVQLDSPPSDGGSNTAVALLKLFSPKSLERADKASRELIPEDRFTFSPMVLEKMIRLRQKYEQAWLNSRAAYDLPHCNFGLMHKAGFFADTSFIDVVCVCGRLEAFQAAECLSNNDLAGAVKSLGYMFRGAESLGNERHVICRIEAARLRRIALAVAEAIVLHPNLDVESITHVYAMVAAQLDHWPQDSRAWVGDRALGLHTYEAIRGGDLIWLLTDQEMQRLVEETNLSVFEAAALRGIDADEIFYLRTMRDVIAACEQPFYRRREVFVRTRLRLNELEDTPEYPVIAGRMLLGDIEQGQRIQAEDRAACEAWCLALALAAGQSPPPYQLNPLSGKPYQVELLPGQTIVAAEGKPADPWYTAIVVPWPERTQQSARRDKARVQ